MIVDMTETSTAYVIAQLSDTHVGGPNEGSGERLSQALAEIQSMTRRPDLVLLTGDLTHNGTDDEWAEFQERLGALTVPWEAIAGNHDRGIAALSGHRAMDAGPLRLVLLDTSDDTFDDDDAAWLERELTDNAGRPTVIAIHQPPFETGIWWMDCVGLKGMALFESVVRPHRHVIQVLAGHVHRLIQSNWDGCTLWVCPSTSVSVAADLDPFHDPAETAEGPSFSLHAYVNSGVVSHLVPVGAQATRNLIKEHAPEFITWVTGEQQRRESLFS